MTTTPFEPHEEPTEDVAAADPGRGAPGSGVEDEEPDETPEGAAGKGEAVEPPD
jgi:hypothetical protein